MELVRANAAFAQDGLWVFVVCAVRERVRAEVWQSSSYAVASLVEQVQMLPHRANEGTVLTVPTPQLTESSNLARRPLCMRSHSKKQKEHKQKKTPCRNSRNWIGQFTQKEEATERTIEKDEAKRMTNVSSYSLFQLNAAVAAAAGPQDKKSFEKVCVPRYNIK